MAPLLSITQTLDCRPLIFLRAFDITLERRIVAGGDGLLATGLRALHKDVASVPYHWRGAAPAKQCQQTKLAPKEELVETQTR